MSGPTLAIDATARAITLDGTPVTLGARAFDVLAHLHENRDRVVSKAELLEPVWGGLAVEEGNLTVQISALRKVLGAKAIATVPGVGYKLTVEAEPEKDPRVRRCPTSHRSSCCPSRTSPVRRRTTTSSMA
jgi:DNA-binding winged helix-turn-helix (wHTH) protein